MRALYFLLLFAFLPIGAWAQTQYRITYDYLSGEVKREVFDEESRQFKPHRKKSIKRHSVVEIKVVNLNPLAADVVPELRENNVYVDNGTSRLTIGTVLSSFSRDALSQNLNFEGQNLMSGLTGTQRKGMEEGGFGFESLEEESLEEDFGRADAYQAILDDINGKMKDLSSAYAQVEAIKSQLTALVLNPSSTKAEIREGLRQQAQLLDLDVSYMQPGINEQPIAYLSKLEQLIRDTSDEITPNLRLLASTASATGELGALRMREAGAVQTQLDANRTLALEEIQRLKKLLIQLESTNFEYARSYPVRTDQLDLTVQVLESDLAESLDNDNTKTLYKTLNFRFDAVGGWRVNTGVALTLNNFGGSSKEYFVTAEGQIGEDDNNYFTPNLSTLISFYPELGRGLNLGGAFGVSVPISTGEQNISGVNFLLGGSLILGRQNRISLSGGLAYGPVDKLTNGLRPGDVAPSGNPKDFTRRVYDIGYFFGISFTLANIN